MKKQSLFWAALMIWAAIPSVAQSNFNQDEVVKIDRHNQRAYREGEVLVKFKGGSGIVQSGARSTNASGVNKVLGALGVTELEQLMPLTGEKQVPTGARAISDKHINDFDMSNLYRVRFDAQRVPSVEKAIENMKGLSEVEFAEPNYIVYTLADEASSVNGNDKNDPFLSEQWGHGQLKLDKLEKQPKLTNERPVIAILDTGVDITHPDLEENIWTNTLEAEGEDEADDDNNGFADDLHGWDFVNQTGRIGDRNGHGTHCAGIAAAVTNNGKGIVAANPDALIMPITVMQSDGTGDVATIIKGIDYAVANGADILSMSFGGYAYSIAEEQALAKAYSKAVLVAAAGNDYKCIYAHDCPVNKKNAVQNGPMYPAAFTFVLGVEAGIKDGSLASFSNFDEDGPVFSQYNENQLYNYELRAPGTSIISTYPGGKYKVLSGTSMACPYVAGGISLLLQRKEYSSWEVLFGDLIHTRKQNGNGNVDFEAAYHIKDTDRIPELGLVTYALKDTIEGDGDGKADAGETIAFYPTLRNEWGQAKNIRFSLELAEAEDPTIVQFLDEEVDFGKELSSYAKNASANPIRFKINTDCVDGRKICMVFRATCDNIKNELVQEFTLTAENGVELGGLISEDMTLYPNVHYIITKTLVVQEGVVLTIEPGTVLKFKKDVSLYIPKGSLHCEGEPGNMIVFTMADHETGYMRDLHLNKNTVKYVHFSGLRIDDEVIYGLSSVNMDNCIVENCYTKFYMLNNNTLNQTNLIYSEGSTQLWASSGAKLYNSNIIGNIVNENNTDFWGQAKYFSSNAFGNIGRKSGEYTNIGYYSAKGNDYTPESPNYLGSAREDIIRKGLWDMNHPTYNLGFGNYNLSNTLTQPSAEAHGIVWKVVVNGSDAQDKFEQLPPLGVGKHKFEVYFNRPMNKEAIPMIAMGVRPPYTSHAIAEEASWNEEGTIYTAYMTITGKTGADGLNRIYVSGAEDDEYFEIPIENTRFNVQVAAAGSMATGLMAEAGLGKVSLIWETDEEDFEDLLGYNLYRYTLNNEGISSDSIIVNPSVLEAEETEFVDYDVVPGTTYYYVIKQLTTSLSSHALSNAVAATPLTAKKGDANGSMEVDVADIVTEVAYMTNQNPQPFIFEAADVNSDQNVNILDVVGTLNIISTPENAGITSVNNTATYTMENGILYVESPVALGGVQIRIAATKGTEISTMDGLNGFELLSHWQSDEEYLFLAYSMVGRTIGAGKQALLRIGDDVTISQVVLSDARGRNVLAINADATGLGAVEAMQMTLPYPNPFSSQLTIPYIIGKEGNHQVNIVVSDLAGRAVYRYAESATFGEYTHTWTPAGNLAKGLYLVSLYVDGSLMHTAKVIYNK